MWQPDRTRLLKVRLHNQGEDAETLWAEDLGAAPLSPARYVRIANIPIFHFKPTYGDVIEVTRGDGMLEWDRHGHDSDEIGARLLEDGGRWVAVIDYWPARATSSLQSAIRRLDRAGAARDIAVEGVVARKGRGCAYLAVPGSMSLGGLLAWLHSLRAGVGFELRHPEVDSP